MLAVANISIAQTRHPMVEVIRDDPRPLMFFLSGVAAGQIVMIITIRKEKDSKAEDDKKETDCQKPEED